MGRLIDADNLEKELLELCGDKPPMFYYFSKAIKVIREQPTAYDMDKVVEELKKEFKKYYGGNWDKAPYLVKAIEIVKGAVKE